MCTTARCRIRPATTPCPHTTTCIPTPRASFAVSCFVLVLVGCAMGMMFRSGNFLTAFAVSFIPALMTITLIIAGQQTCGNIPWNRGAHWVNPLNTGIALIWSGNAINLLLAIGLLWRLQRQ